ncbi:LysR family transcriptional regulator [Paenibacillus spongiae]|uniref:LysR family transcriptional regulator n=1 Tax=Paenibacillus spongiae TaxID=2909671 RepID=A0ABY5S504_9BACL|nr:LysR family transcriptional regulator [Paenibacillus spongiae]UVI28982.1 LysR family transcriptional regulator [Paenibacillus spongiae]
MLNLEWYRIFLHTAKAGNLTKAAQELYITQPSVSYAIKQLEGQLGLKLFHRLSKGVELTAEGQALLGYVERSLTLLDAGEQRMDALKRLAAGELRIGASDSLMKHLLLGQLDEYRTLYPNVRIRLSHGKTPDLIERLKDGLTDCIIVPMPVDDPMLEIQPLSAIQDTFVVGDAYRSLSDKPLTGVEIASTPLLLLSQGSGTRRFLERWLAGQGVAVEADIELGSVDLLVEFARRGFGAAFVIRSFVASELEAGELFELRTAEPIPPRTIGIAVRRGMPLPLASSRFIDMLSPKQLMS